MRQKIDTVIFDMDGTVLDTLQDLADAVNAALKAFAMPERTIDEVRSFVGNGVRRLLELSVPDGFATVFTAMIRRRRMTGFCRYCGSWKRKVMGWQSFPINLILR